MENCVYFCNLYMMTSTIALAIAFSLLIYDLSLLPSSSNIIEGEHPESKLVYLLTVSLLLKRLPVCPRFIWMPIPISLLVEIPLCLILLECSLTYLWKLLHEYLLLYSDDILVNLYEDVQFSWIICHLCCGKSGCSDVFTSLILKVMSFVFLLTICFATVTFKNKV